MTKAINTELECEKLRQRIIELEQENIRMMSELEFLKTHSSMMQGIKGETLVARLIDGKLTSFSESYDVATSTGLRIEVKFSKLNRPMKNSPTRRWNWSKPLGWLDKGKDYHYLLLIGEKDERYLADGLDSTPYVYFLVPIQNVPDVMNQGRSIGGMVQITTNLAKLEKKQNKQNRPQLLDFHVGYKDLKTLLENSSVT